MDRCVRFFAVAAGCTTTSRFSWCMVVVALLLSAMSGTARAFSSGITTQFFGPLGCNQCHSGGGAPAVALDGPTSVAPGATNEYTLTVSATGEQNHAGLNVSAAVGTLQTGGSSAQNTQVLSGEITHTAPKSAVGGEVTFSFLWTAPTSFDQAQLRVWGNAVNLRNGNRGDRASSAQLTISAESQDSPTPTATVSPTGTASPTIPAATATGTTTPTPSATPTATATTTTGPASCLGDCSDDGQVTVDEIIRGVGIALGDPLENCPVFDGNDDGVVTVDEIVRAVRNALEGCSTSFAG